MIIIFHRESFSIEKPEADWAYVALIKIRPHLNSRVFLNITKILGELFKQSSSPDAPIGFINKISSHA